VEDASIYLYIELDLDNAGGSNPGVEDASIYLYVKLDLDNAGGSNPGVEDASYLYVKLDLDNAGGSNPGVEDILSCGYVGILPQPLYTVQKISRNIYTVKNPQFVTCKLYIQYILGESSEIVHFKQCRKMVHFFLPILSLRSQ
jgi:hypothetical protein